VSRTVNDEERRHALQALEHRCQTG
jgi:hypothetical protein